MKKILLVLGLLLFTAGVLALLLCDSQLFAVTGCCKQRGSPNHPWRDNGMNFGQCSELNQRLDGDNIFRESGFVWWDRGC